MPTIFDSDAFTAISSSELATVSGGEGDRGFNDVLKKIFEGVDKSTNAIRAILTPRPPLQH